MGTKGKHLAIILGLLVMLMGMAMSSAQAKTELTWSWDNGLTFGDEEGSFKLKFGGRIHHDYVFWGSVDDEIENALGEQESGTEFRRARLFISGTIFDRVIFKNQWDFANGDADAKNVYVGINEIPGLGTLRFGHYKEYFTLEEMTSDNFITFQERSLANAFGMGYNTGIGFHNTVADGRFWYGANYHWITDDSGTTIDTDATSFTVRAAGLPWYDEESDGRYLFHLGGDFTTRGTVEDAIRFRTRPEVHIADRWVDTGTLEMVDRYHTYALEAALVAGAFSAQGEYIQTELDSSALGDPTFSGYYVFASYFLTQENRPYKKSKAAFSTVKPKNNFLKEGGLGAWEVAVRYSFVDLSDSTVYGGEQSNVTLGVNWYLNPNTRMMLNFVNADVDVEREYGGTGNAFTMRFQINW